LFQGMVDAGENLSVALKREFGEEALNSLSTSHETEEEFGKKRMSDLKEVIDQVFQQGVEVSESIRLI